jgi:hypothetical protein
MSDYQCKNVATEVMKSIQGSGRTIPKKEGRHSNGCLYPICFMQMSYDVSESSLIQKKTN